MATPIQINRNGSVVTFETVSVITADLVFWINNDPRASHWPSLSPNQIGPAPSPNSSPTALVNPGGTPPADPPNLAFQVVYTDRNDATLKGVINVFQPFQVAAKTALPAATKNTPIPPQPVATGGISPYTFASQIHQVTDASGSVTSSGPGPGPGLTLTASTNNAGITVGGTPTLSGTYTFTFDVTDGMGLNIQQTQFTMVVS